MKRKLFLLVSTFIVLLFGFGTYKLFSPSGGSFDPKPLPRPGFGSLEDGPSVENVRALVLYERDSDGKITGEYRVASWSKEEDGSFSLVKPKVCVYHPDGRRTYVRSARGRLYAEQVAEGIHVRHGRLEGDVEIFYDQSRAMERPDPWDRTPARLAEEVIRIFSNDIYFNRDMLEIHTDSRITVWSKELDIVGRGLQLKWNESPRELRKLRLEEGDVLIVKELDEQMEFIQVPLKGSAPTSSTAGTEKSGTPAPRAAADDAKESSPVAAADADTAGADTEPVARNIYTADFKQNVRVWSGDRQLTGAALLNLEFEWDRAWRPGGDEEGEEPAASGPATRPAETVAGVTPGTASRPATAGTRKTNRMEVYWEGPLEITPTGTTPDPNRERYAIVGSGETVVIREGGTRLMCSDFSFENPRQKAVFEAGEDQVTRLQLNPGEEIICAGKITFDRSEGAGRLHGPGQLVRYDRDPLYESFPYGFIPADPRRVTEEITWKDHVDVAFIEQTVRDGGGSRPVIDSAVFTDSVQLRRYVSSPAPESRPAPAAEKTDEPAPDGYDYLDCDRLKVTMGFSPDDGKTFPARAMATGSVRALLEGAALTAEEATVEFRPVADAPGNTTETRPAAANTFTRSARVEPKSLEAYKSVKLVRRDPARPDESPLEVEGDYVKTLMNYDPDNNDRPARLGVLTGRPALVRRDNQHIRGNKIYFDEENEGVVVKGAGELVFVTDQDLSGNVIEKPEPIKIAWADGMEYFGGEHNRCVFNRDIELKSGGRYISCRQMRVFFKDTVPKEEGMQEHAGGRDTAPEEAGPASEYAFGLNLDEFSEKKISQIECVGGRGDEKNVFMKTLSLDPNQGNALARRRQIRGRKVLTDIVNGKAYVQGPGSLLAEDYRPPVRKEDENGTRDSLVKMVEGRPSQTLCMFKKGMWYSQEKRYARFKDGVDMRYRNGNEVYLTENLNVAPWAWGRLEEGRIMKLRADFLEIWFDEPLGEEESRARREKQERGEGLSPLEAGSPFGPPKIIQASDGVVFSDSNGETRSDVECQRLLFDNGKNLANIWGYDRSAKRKKNARVIISRFNDAGEIERVETIESPTFIFDIENQSLKNSEGEKLEFR